MTDAEATGGIAAALDAVKREVPDDAPPCVRAGCDTLGVVPQVNVAAEGSRIIHWCLAHAPDYD